MNKNLKHLVALSLIAHGDESHPAEEAFLKSVAKRLNIDDITAAEIIDQPEEYDQGLQVQETDRYTFLGDILKLIAADGNIDDDEIEYCRTICKKLGFEQQMVDDIIMKMKAHIDNGCDQNKLSKTIESGLNRLTSKITKHDRNN